MEIAIRGGIPDSVELIETFGWRVGEGARFLDAHLNRMERSAKFLGFPFDRIAAERATDVTDDDALRCRLTLNGRGVFSLTTARLVDGPLKWRVAVHGSRLRSDDPWLQVKSTQRAFYDNARAALPDAIDEFLFLNEFGALCEGTITNLFVVLADGRKVTPPLRAGLLPGVLREHLLNQDWSEHDILPADLTTAAEICVGNAMRGLIPVEMVEITHST